MKSVEVENKDAAETMLEQEDVVPGVGMYDEIKEEEAGKHSLIFRRQTSSGAKRRS